MGQRGPGAKPTRKTALPAPGKRRRKPRWQWRGLTRAERVIAFVQAYIDAGAKKIILGPTWPDPAQIERIAQEVVPLWR